MHPTVVVLAVVCVFLWTTTGVAWLASFGGSRPTLNRMGRVLVFLTAPILTTILVAGWARDRMRHGKELP